MLETISYQNIEYPLLQSKGFASQYAFPFAKQICKGVGLDVGYMKEEWKLADAIGIEPAINPEFHALNLPEGQYDFIFSSHCLEHTDNWVSVLDYWQTKIKSGGVIFLYLPHPSQIYWRPYNNRKHVHVMQPEILKDYFEARGWKKIFVTGADLNSSFMVVAEK